MKALIIDSTGDKLVVVVVNGEKSYPYIGDKGAKRHTSAILAAVDEKLEEAGIKITDVENLGVVVGPGSFTGIRIGIATVNAFGLALGARITPITALEPSVESRDNVIALLDCKHDNYYALVKKNGEESYASITKDDIKTFGADAVYVTEPNVEALLKVFERKTREGKTVERAEPFYMKKSSAEMQFNV